MVVHGRRGQRAVVLLNDLLRLPNFELVAPAPPEADAAYAAFVSYGRGSGHPAGLNFGDVFSYALAKVRGFVVQGRRFCPDRYTECGCCGTGLAQRPHGTGGRSRANAGS
jgi:uncharacterized protein with PIN domain